MYWGANGLIKNNDRVSLTLDWNLNYWGGRVNYFIRRLLNKTTLTFQATFFRWTDKSCSKSCFWPTNFVKLLWLEPSSKQLFSHKPQDIFSWTIKKGRYWSKLICKVAFVLQKFNFVLQKFKSTKFNFKVKVVLLRRALIRYHRE